MIDFYSLLELAQIRAINCAIEPSIESIWRMKCRSYSQMFYTPLDQVYKLDPLLVMQALNEEKYPPNIVDDELDELLDILQKIKDPNYGKMSDQETEDLVDLVLNKEIVRLAKKKAPTRQTIASEIKTAEVKKTIPKSGGLDFSELEKFESKSEANKNGF